MYQGKKTTADELLGLIATLVGPIEPVNDSAVDYARKQNVETLIGLAKELHIVLDKLASDHSESQYGSAKEIGKLADDYLDWLGIQKENPYKDLPKWKKATEGKNLIDKKPVAVFMGVFDKVLFSNYIGKDDYYINLDDLKTLPKEE